MKLYSFVRAIVASTLGVAVLCGCSSGSKPAPASKQTAVTTPGKSLPRDPAIDAYVGAMRADLSSGKVQTINGVMQLSDAEAKVFWPIYQEYETELFELGDQRVDLIRRFVAAQRGGSISPNDATVLADNFFKFEQQQLDLKKAYHGIIAKELSPVRAAQFAQIEHRVGTIVDLTIAAELPLIQAHTGMPPLPSGR